MSLNHGFCTWKHIHKKYIYLFSHIHTHWDRWLRGDLLVHFRSMYKILFLPFKVLVYLSDLIEKYLPVRMLLSESYSLLRVPIMYGERSFPASAPRLWNKLVGFDSTASCLQQKILAIVLQRSIILEKGRYGQGRVLETKAELTFRYTGI